MSILLNDNLSIQAPKATDYRYGPFADTATALTSVILANRYQGLTIGIGSGTIIEYWFRDGTTDANLILKVDNTANTSSANTIFTQGVDLSQNTSINNKLSLTGSLNQTVSGNVTISQDLIVSGNLILTGNISSQNVQQLAVADPLIVLGLGNYVSDTKDIGFAGHYNDGQNAHTGIVRDSVTKEWYVFKGYTPELDSNNNVIITDPSFSTANLNANVFKGNLIGNSIVINGLDLYNYSTSSFAQANLTAGGLVTANANTIFLTGVNTTQNTWISSNSLYSQAAFALANLTSGGLATANANTVYLSGVNTTQNTWISSNSLYSQAAFAQANLTAGGLVTANANTIFLQGALATANANTVFLSGVNSTQNTWISSNSLYSQAAFALANLTSGGLSTANANTVFLTGALATTNANTIFLSGVNTTQNTWISSNSLYSQAAFAQANLVSGGLNTANANTIYTQGVDLAQNNSISLLQGGLNTANANIAYILGVDLAQNTYAQSVNTYSYAAFSKANTSIQTSGGSITGNLNITGNLIVNGSNTFLGNIANVHIVGGNTGQIITTDSFGNLSFIDLPTTNTISYVAQTISLTNGVYVSGSVTDVQTLNDGNFYSITDGSNTGPAWIITCTFTGISSFNRIVSNVDYTLASGHTVYFQLYNYTTTVWDNIGSYSGSSGYSQYALEVLGYTSYISGGTVQARLYHSNTGNVAHATKLDYFALEKSAQGAQGPRGATGATGSTGATGPVDPSAFDRANSANSLAQSAYDKANTDYTTLVATAGVYGNSTYVPVITLSANGRVTSITNTAILATGSGGSSSGYLANSVIFANSTGYLSNTANIFFFEANNNLVVANTIKSGDLILTGTATGTSSGTGALRVVGGAYFGTNTYTNGYIDGSSGFRLFGNIVLNSNRVTITGTTSNSPTLQGAAGFGSGIRLTGESILNVTGETGVVPWVVYHSKLASYNVNSSILPVTYSNLTTLLLDKPTWNIANTNITVSNTYSLWANGSIYTENNFVSAGNVIIGGANGITFADGTIQTTAASGAATDTTARNLAQAAFTTANSSSNTAGSASSNTIFTQGVDLSQNTSINNKLSLTGALNQTVSGNVTISQDLIVSGNLTITGNLNSLNVQSFGVADPLLVLGLGNYLSDTRDIGFAGHYNDGQNAHTGLIRDAGTKEFYFFKGYTPELDSNNNVIITDPSFATANLNASYVKGNLIANSVVVNGVDLYNYASVAAANTVYITGGLNTANANTIYTQGVDLTQNNNISLLQGGLNTANANTVFLSGVNSTQNTWISSNSLYSQAAFAQANLTAGGLVTANANTIYTQGVDLAQNNSITLLQGGLNTANANTIFLSGALATTNANTIFTQGVDASQNTWISSNSLYSQAAFAQANLTAGGLVTANSNITFTQGVDLAQNTSINNKLSLTGALNQTVSGNVTISQDLIVSGNLTITGNLNSLNVQSFGVADPLLVLGLGNYLSDTKDIGFAGHYNDGTNAHAGLIRDAGTKEFYFFKGYTPELDSNNNVIITDPSFTTANLNASYVKGNLIANTVVVNGIDLYNYASTAAANTVYLQGGLNTANANTIYTQGVDLSQNNSITLLQGGLNTANANTVFLAGALNTANANTIFLSGVNSTQNTWISSNSLYSQAAFAQANLTAGGLVTANANTIFLQGALATTNANTIYTQGVDLAQNNSITLLQGGLNTANANTLFLQGALNTANANTIFLSGVNTSQNANIIAVQILANTDYTFVSSPTGTFGSSTLVPVVTVAANGRITNITTTAVSGGGGSSSNSFSTILVSGQPNVIANTATSPLTLVAGSGITITTVGTSNTITFASTGGFSGGTIANQLIIANSNSAISTTTGALQVQGGVGVSGNVYTSNVSITSSTLKANATFTLGNTSTTNTASMIYNASLNSIDFYFN